MEPRFTGITPRIRKPDNLYVGKISRQWGDVARREMPKQPPN